jgi:hypothetical protein
VREDNARPDVTKSVPYNAHANARACMVQTPVSRGQPNAPVMEGRCGLLLGFGQCDLCHMALPAAHTQGREQEQQDT